MDEKIKAVFGVLGVEPNEKFEIIKSINNFKFKNKFYIDDSLNIRREDDSHTILNIKEFLTGINKIIKLPNPQQEAEKERLKIVARYFKLLGYSYIAKDKDNKIYAYIEKPFKDFRLGCWYRNNSLDRSKTILIECNLSNIRWEDDEPISIDAILSE